MKGVILAGGSGTRLHPLTKITNKHLLPIYNRPMVMYAVEALVKAGVDDIMLVTGGIHAGEFFRLLGNGHEYGIRNLLYSYQEEPNGIAGALRLAERFVDRDNFVVMLADNIFEYSIRESVKSFEYDSGAKVILNQKPISHLKNLGVAKFINAGLPFINEEEDKLIEIVEKPVNPPSDWAVTGLYFYDYKIWYELPTLRPSDRGELEISDINNWYIEHDKMSFDIISDYWGDAGESIDTYYDVNDHVRFYGANK